MNQTKATIDHDEIKRWAEARNAVPSRVKRTGGSGDLGMIRLDFPGYSGKDSLEPVSWDEFFEKFEQSQLALVYRENLARGGKSNFNKLVGRETVDTQQHSGRRTSLPRRRAKEQARAGGTARRAGPGRPTRGRARGTDETAEAPRSARAKKRGKQAPSTASRPRKTAAKRGAAASGRTKRVGAKRAAPRKAAKTRARG